MSRLPRSQFSTYTYFHVCARGNGGQDIFLDDKDRIRYLCLIEKYRMRYGLECYAYCLMTNHIHLLWLCPSIQKLSKAMHGLQVAYVVYFNRRHKRHGHLFESRFTSWVVKNEAHLLSTKEYVENNSVKAGLINTVEDYLWSSASRDRSIVTLSSLIT